MRRWISLLLTLAALLSLTSALAQADKYAVTEPITIQFWHTHEERFAENLQYMFDEFKKVQPLITVEPVYIGSYADMNERFISAVAAGDVPAIATSNTSYPAAYGASGILEPLAPYIEATGFDVADFGEGLIASTSYDGQQIALPYLISTQVLYYNKTVTDAEGLAIPKTLDEMDAFLQKATKFNPDGTTARWGTIFGGWDYWYTEMLFKNNGVKVVDVENNTTDINGEAAVAITEKLKEWVDKGYAYYAYGTGASSTMRQTFWDGNAASVFHTSSLYDTYVSNVGDKFEVGMAWLPGGNDGETFTSEVGGAVIMIPEKASQAQKNAAWQLMQFMTSPEINLYWADKTGYFPTRQSVIGTPAYEEYLGRKPAMQSVVSMANWINPRNQAPAYDAAANLWRDALAKILVEGAPVRETLDAVAEEITELLEDQ
jgi:multiple sugar transport system substrate-binding protein